MIDGASRILILAPHPDDEIVACGIAAMRARAAGAQVFVFYLTTGVPERTALWPWRRREHSARVNRRHAEAHAAAALLGLQRLGKLGIASRRLRGHLDEAATAIADAVAACTADAVWVPAFEGGHQDHDAANALAANLADRLPVWEFAAYNFAGGRVRANAFLEARGNETVLQGTAAEAERKRQALACYVSERGNLRHVGVTQETCRPLPWREYGSPPHEGRLFRERFHWVPFRHPRIDFASSDMVYRDIGDWASARLAYRRPPFDHSPGGEPRQADGEFAGTLDEPQGQGRIGR